MPMIGVDKGDSAGSGDRSARRPRHIGLGFLTLGGFIGGVMFWGAFNTALELTNTEKFCTSLPRDARQRLSRS